MAGIDADRSTMTPTFARRASITKSSARIASVTQFRGSSETPEIMSPAHFAKRTQTAKRGTLTSTEPRLWEQLDASRFVRESKESAKPDARRKLPATSSEVAMNPEEFEVDSLDIGALPAMCAAAAKRSHFHTGTGMMMATVGAFRRVETMRH
jgi:hypothetical protein